MALRPVHRWLWAAALALLVQLGAPIWALSMLAAQALDPAAGMPMCSQDATQGDHGPPLPHHGSVCPICQFAGHAGQLVLPTSPGAVAPAEISGVSPVRHSIAEPRAPPSLHTQARAPPTTF